MMNHGMVEFPEIFRYQTHKATGFDTGIMKKAKIWEPIPNAFRKHIAPLQSGGDCDIIGI